MAMPIVKGAPSAENIANMVLTGVKKCTGLSGSEPARWVRMAFVAPDEDSSSVKGNWKWILLTCVLLSASCAVMVVAWYLNLKYPNWPMWKAIILSWLIAAGEYALQVPGNRIGHTKAGLSAYQLRAIAEVAVLVSFLIFNTTVLKEKLLWCHIVGFALVLVGVLIVMVGDRLGSSVY